MTFNSVPSKERESVCSGDHLSHRPAGTDTARQPASQASKKRLARGFAFAVGFSVCIPLISFASAYLKMDLQGAIGVSCLIGLIVLCIMVVTSEIYDEMVAASEREAEEREHAATCMKALRQMEQDYNDLQEIYAQVYAAYIEQRGAVPLVAKRARGAAADSPSGVNGSAAVVHEFPNPKGAA